LEGGAYTGDIYSAYGRWKARHYPVDRHLADDNPLTVGRVGLRAAMGRIDEATRHVSEAARQEQSDAPEEHLDTTSEQTPAANDDPIVQTIVAVYDALEWIHSLDEHLKNDGRYKDATELDPVAGAFVEGAIGARNASHHGLRRVVGAVNVPASTYVAHGPLWVLSNEPGPVRHRFVQVRWVEDLPGRIEAKHAGKAALRIPDQLTAYQTHLAGREVRNTLLTCWGFFLYSVDGEEIPPEMVFSPGIYPPNIDPAALRF